MKYEDFTKKITFTWKFEYEGNVQKWIFVSRMYYRRKDSFCSLYMKRCPKRLLCVMPQSAV